MQKRHAIPTVCTQPYCRSCMAYPQKRSTVNAFAKWATQVGDSSYNFQSVLPYYEKSVQFTPPDYSKRTLSPSVKYDPSAFSPQGGPLHVSFWNYYFPVSKYFAKAYQKLGLTEVGTIQSGSLLTQGSNAGSYAQWPATVQPAKEIRDSSESSFLQSALRRKLPVTVYDRTLAKRILFDANKNAIGVNVSTSGTTYTLSAKKEVLVAAGAVSSSSIKGVGALLQSVNLTLSSAHPSC